MFRVQVGTVQRPKNVAVNVSVSGADGVPLTPGKAASVLEKHIALLKKKIQQKTSSSAVSKTAAKPASVPLPSQPTATGAQSAIGTTAGSLSLSGKSTLISAPAAAYLASRPPVVTSSAMPPAIGKVIDQGLRSSLVGERRSRSPNSEMEPNRPSPLLEMRRQTQNNSPAPTPASETASQALTIDPPVAAKVGGEGRLQLAERSRSPAVEAPNVRKRSPVLATAHGQATTGVSGTSVARSEVRQGSSAPSVAGPALIGVSGAVDVGLAPKDSGRMDVERGHNVSNLVFSHDSGTTGDGPETSEKTNAAASARRTHIAAFDDPSVSHRVSSRMESDHSQDNIGQLGSSFNVSELEAALSGSALSAESLQKAREVAERRLRGVRRLMEENLREDLELQAWLCFCLTFEILVA
jgi:hypothetical protein